MMHANGVFILIFYNSLQMQNQVNILHSTNGGKTAEITGVMLTSLVQDSQKLMGV